MEAGGGARGMGNIQGMQPGGGMSGMERMQKMMGAMEGMDMMGMMSGMQGMQGMKVPQSALPGFAGASHIYHIGATGFFLDHAEHIGLSAEQQVGLNKIKDQALALKAASDRQIEQAEQELATLTSSDQPDVKKIEAKVREIAKLGSDIRQVWTAPAITDRDRKELLRTLLEEVILNLKRAEGHAHLTLRWRGGAITVVDVPVPRFKPMGPCTDEDTISLLRRLAALYPDEVIAGILNRQGRQTATGERFTANQVGSLRRYRDIPRFQPSAEPPTGELVSIRKAAQILGMNTSSIHRWRAGHARRALANPHHG